MARKTHCVIYLIRSDYKNLFLNEKLIYVTVQGET